MAALLVLVAAACSDDGRTLRPPSADQTTTTAAPDSGEVPSQQPGADGFTVRVDGFLPGAPLPASLTCDGDGQAPVVTWQNVPADAGALALALTDQSADGDVLWLVVGIDPGLAGIEGDDLPPGATTLPNSVGDAAWRPPCLPGGSDAHDFVFTLYALGDAAAVGAGEATTVISDLAGASLSTAAVAGTYPPPAESATSTTG